MTGRFETLIYTDCRPGQGLRGDSGLQFQAKSAGARPSDLDLVQRALLYEPPPGWINANKSRKDYPPSLAHVWDPSRSVLATAQGEYLGRETVAMREGNQITHAIVTSDPEAYEFIRPAQLLHAPFWTAEPSPSARCPALEPGWQPGPAEPEAIRDFVAAQEDGRGFLVTLLSALHGLDTAHANRVLFIAERPEEVVQWIAAATLLLPQRKALTVGFKAFTLNPRSCAQPVVAVHPDWAGPYRSLDPSSGFVVLDLVARRHTDVTTDELAGPWVDLFLQADPYDVMDAVELASTIAASGAAPQQSYAVATAMTFGHVARRSDVPLAANWVADGPADLVADHGETVAASLLEQASMRDLRRLDKAAIGRVPGIAAEIRISLLRSEISAAVSGSKMPAERLPALPGEHAGSSAGSAMADLVIDALRSVSYEAIDLVLRTAWRHRVAVPVAAFADRASHFAAWWADRPDLHCDPSCWPNRTQLLALLREQLSARMAPASSRRAETAGTVRRHWWQLLLDETLDPFEALDSVVIVGAMRAGDTATRTELVQRLIRDASSSVNAVAAINRACEVLWCERDPEAGEALAALKLIPDHIVTSSRLTDALRRALDTGWQQGDLAGALDSVQILRARRCDVPRGWRELSQADRRLNSLCAALPQLSGQQREVVRKLREVDHAVVVARAGQLAAALGELDDPDVVAFVLAECPELVGSSFLHLFARDYARAPAPTVRKQFRLLAARRLPSPIRARLEADLRTQLGGGGTQLVSSVTQLLAKDGKTARADWESWLASQVDGRGWLRR